MSTENYVDIAFVPASRWGHGNCHVAFVGICVRDVEDLDMKDEG